MLLEKALNSNKNLQEKVIEEPQFSIHTLEVRRVVWW